MILVVLAVKNPFGNEKSERYRMNLIPDFRLKVFQFRSSDRSQNAQISSPDVDPRKLLKLWIQDDWGEHTSMASKATIQSY